MMMTYTGYVRSFGVVSYVNWEMSSTQRDISMRKFRFCLFGEPTGTGGPKAFLPLIQKYLPIVVTTPTRRFGSERPRKCTGWIVSILQKKKRKGSAFHMLSPRDIAF